MNTIPKPTAKNYYWRDLLAKFRGDQQPGRDLNSRNLGAESFEDLVARATAEEESNRLPALNTAREKKAEAERIVREATAEELAALDLEERIKDLCSREQVLLVAIPSAKSRLAEIPALRTECDNFVVAVESQLLPLDCPANVSQYTSAMKFLVESPITERLLPRAIKALDQRLPTCARSSRRSPDPYPRPHEFLFFHPPRATWHGRAAWQWFSLDCEQ